MAEPYVIAAVGFGSALLGAVAGHMGALHIESIRNERRRLATIKGLIHEITINAQAVHMTMVDLSQDLPLSDTFWRDVRTMTPLYLDDDTYDCLASAYALIPRFEKTLQRYREHQKDEDKEELLRYTDETLKAARSMLEAQRRARLPVWAPARYRMNRFKPNPDTAQEMNVNKTSSPQPQLPYTEKKHSNDETR